MSFRDFIIIYVEVGLVLAIVEPILWHILKPGDWHDTMSQFKGDFQYDCGFALGTIIGTVVSWPIHLVAWYILDPIMAKRESKKES